MFIKQWNVGFFSSSKGLVDFTLCQQSRELLIFPFLLQPNDDCLSVFFPLGFAWVLEYLMHMKLAPAYDLSYLMQTAYLKRIFNYNNTSTPQWAYSTIVIPVGILISYFSHSLGNKVTAQRTPSDTPAKAQQTENNPKHPVYSTNYMFMEPKCQSILSPTSFPLKLGKR